MLQKHKFGQILFSAIIILTLTISSVTPTAVLAQDGDGSGRQVNTQTDGDDVKRQINSQTGRISFIGPESGRVLPASSALGTFVHPQDPARALAIHFAPEFGLKDPARDLIEMRPALSEDGRVTVRYQQTFQGIPVMGGELIVNTNDRGDLYSMSGEVSQDLSLLTQPTIDSAQATEMALGAMAKWYKKNSADFEVTTPELWIYDESLLRPSTRPVELVWRMEVTAIDNAMPVRELVLVDAQRGGISLHFNQIDYAWADSNETPHQPQSAPPVISQTVPNRTDPAIDESTATSSGDFLPNLLGVTWYVATTGNDSNSCSSTGSPCLTINGAIGKATAGDTIMVAGGTYTGTTSSVVNIDKDIILSGSWDPTFTSHSIPTIIDGQSARGGIAIGNIMPSVVTIEYFRIENGISCSGGGIISRGSLTLRNSTLSNNNGGDTGCAGGGGVWSYGSLVIDNSTLSGNFSRGGGGVHLSGGSADLNNVTLTDNLSTYQGGGIYVESGTLTIRNSILARNTATGFSPDCSGNISSLGYNLLGNNSGCTFSTTTGDLVGTGASPINPRLNPLQDNGGATFTHSLIVGSPAINAGNLDTPGGGGNACLATDQRGVARPVESRCDIGAYEGSVPWVPSPYVSTYTASSSSSLPGTFLCSQAQPNCTNGSNPHADAAHEYAIGTYNFYANNFNRDSIDNNGMTIVSTVDYCDPNFPCPYANAFWDGTQMVYGSAEGWPLADDVVGHELTHGVTQYESSLFYYYQSGAINESLSDVFGEYYDQTNGEGNDAANVKWIIGEDISGYPIPSGFTVPALRSMSNPPALGDPDKMSSPNYYEGEGDSGGVHYNSGINNKAVYLMVDGGTFNSKTVSALGWEKVGAIYYEAQTNLLISGSDYSDLYYALQQACTILDGQHGITSGDCVEVKDAIDAVEMNAQPAPNFNTHAPLCDSGDPLSTVFFDDLELGDGNWQYASLVGSTRWAYDSDYGPFATSGEHMLYANDEPATQTDTYVKTKNAISIPANAYLHFSHAFGFEDDTSGTYDGGILEYSTNNGSTWLDAGSLFINNGYNGTIDNNYDNPLKGKSAFVRDSHGYIESRLSLGSLANQNVVFRWRMGLDSYVYDWGWWLDDVYIYTCEVSILQSNFSSVGSYDGWILESGETSNNGGTMNASNSIFYLGDDAQNKQYRAILHFDTSSLPDNAVIVDAKLRLSTNEVVTGVNPFTTHDKIVIELNTGAYSTSSNLQLDDFKLPSDRNGAGAVRDNLVNGFYRGRLKGDVLEYFNLSGATQIRLRFKTDDDNDNVADLIELFSGNASASADRPRLVIYYYVP